MISHYTHCGKIREAVELYEAMDVMPNESSFNAIIKGLVGTEDGSYKAIGFCRKMIEVRFKPSLITLLALDHYLCLVDVLSRVGTWGVGLCLELVEPAEIAAKELLKIEPENPASYVLLGRYI
ncbi:unnamed protein product [Brassica rapa]|uniref:Pentacotripeptide-repeat region of PRORP domain-containing protein n=1 Tax=Brassica campestris TaxID=3711 RepID=A0A8D9HZV5_BRACM|nr:unnamed protein product [Brassica rapa]